MRKYSNQLEQVVFLLLFWLLDLMSKISKNKIKQQHFFSFMDAPDPQGWRNSR